MTIILLCLILKDLKKVLQFASAEGKDSIAKEYGSISTTSLGTILRKVVELEQQGAEKFFGEKSFEVNDLLRIDENGNGSNFYSKIDRFAGQTKIIFNIYAFYACRNLFHLFLNLEIKLSQNW